MIKVSAHLASGYQTTAFSLCLHGAEKERTAVSLPILIRTAVLPD